MFFLLNPTEIVIHLFLGFCTICISVTIIWFLVLYLNKDSIPSPKIHYLVGNVIDVLYNLKTLHRRVLLGHLRHGQIFRTWLFTQVIIYIFFFFFIFFMIIIILIEKNEIA